MPKYHLRVPKDVKKNLRFRKELLTQCGTDRSLASSVREICKRDILFWVNAFCWTFDPRKKINTIPFVTWPFQDKALTTLDKHCGYDDIGIEKSRDMGASWLCLLLFLHQWSFFPGRAFQLISRREALVDSSSDPDSLFWKLDFLLRHQPKFLVPHFRRTKLHLENLDLGSSMDGASTTADVGRGGRRWAMLIDEFGAFEPGDSHGVNAATADNTNCRIYNSTYQGTSGCFYEQMQRPDIVKLTLHWRDHPEKAAGSYMANGRLRSPWYDRQCKRIVTLASIAQELDIDPQGAMSPFFPGELLERLILQDARPAMMRGRIEFDTLAPMDKDSIQFLEDGNGDLMLWTLLPPPKFEISPNEQFVVGADISTGTGATNSVLSIADRRTREKIGEIARTDLDPVSFANLAVATCRYFNDAFLIWEMNGPGGTFGKTVVDQGYRNIYYRQDEQGLEHKISKGLVPGWYASRDNKLLLFREYIRALNSGGFVNRSSLALKECREYRYLPTGGVGNARAYEIDDPSGARENHGDRPTADALANKGLGAEPSVEEIGKEDPEKIPANPPEWSIAWRRMKALEEKKALDSWESNKESLSGWQEGALSLRGW